jgi:hypothetical protein
MKSQSTDLPFTVRIKNILSGIATIRLIKNIEPYEHEDISGYRYDEVEIKLRERADLVEYCQNNFDALFAKGLAEEQKPLVAVAEAFLSKTDYIPQKYGDMVLLGEDTTGFLDHFSATLQMTYGEALAKREEARETIRRLDTAL